MLQDAGSGRAPAQAWTDEKPAAEDCVPNAFGEKPALMFAALTCQRLWSSSPQLDPELAFAANACARSWQVKRGRRGVGGE